MATRGGEGALLPTDLAFAIKNALIERQRCQYEHLHAIAHAALPQCETEKQARDLKAQIRRLAKAMKGR